MVLSAICIRIFFYLNLFGISKHHIISVYNVGVKLHAFLASVLKLPSVLKKDFTLFKYVFADTVKLFMHFWCVYSPTT